MKIISRHEHVLNLSSELPFPPPIQSLSDAMGWPHRPAAGELQDIHRRPSRAARDQAALLRSPAVELEREQLFLPRNTFGLFAVSPLRCKALLICICLVRLIISADLQAARSRLKCPPFSSRLQLTDEAHAKQLCVAPAENLIVGRHHLLR